MDATVLMALSDGAFSPQRGILHGEKSSSIAQLATEHLYDSPERMDSSSPESIDIAALGRAIRFALVCVLLGLCFLNLCCALSINASIAVFKDMLNGRPLPAITGFVIQFRILFTSLSVIVPFCAVMIPFSSQLIRSFYALGLLALLALIELVTVYTALLLPFKVIIVSLGASPGR